MKSLKRLLEKDMGKVYAVVCPNTKFHGHLHLRIMFWGFGFYEDYPQYKRVREVLNSYPEQGGRIHIIKAKCAYCRMEFPS